MLESQYYAHYGGKGIISKTGTIGALALLVLALVLLSGIAYAQEGKAAPEGKKLMIVYTTDDNGELNPCG